MSLESKLSQLGWSTAALDFAKAAYASFHGLSSLDDVEAHLDEPRFCSQPDIMPLNQSVCKWPDGNITWDIVGTIKGLTKDQVQAGITEAFNRWSAVCGIKATYTPGNQKARILVGSRSIDGSLGVLAESELPCGNVSACHQWYDNGERWSLFDGPRTNQTILDFTRVAMHELGHALGMSHIGGGNLLAPTYSDQIWTAQAGDIAEMQSRYGPPLQIPTQPTQPTQPTPNATIIRVANDGTITIDGYRLTKLVS